MKISALWLVVGAVGVSSIAGCKTGETPDKMCESYVAQRKKADWPADDAVKKECVADLTGLKERIGDEKFKRVEGCFGETVTVDQSHVCFDNWARDSKDDHDGAGWSGGIASDASGAWAEGTPKKLDTEACNEGAFVIASRKFAFGLFKTPPEKENHARELAKACKEQKSDAAYAAQFACMRRAKKQADLASCVGGVAANPYGDPDVIEACVSKCSAQHGREATPAYMDCFNTCKASGGK